MVSTVVVRTTEVMSKGGTRGEWETLIRVYWYDRVSVALAGVAEKEEGSRL